MTEQDLTSTRVFLRERFLHLMPSLNGQSATFRLYDGFNAKAEFHGLDLEGEYFLATNLQTPIGEKKSALLRTGDVYSVKVSML